MRELLKLAEMVRSTFYYYLKNIKVITINIIKSKKIFNIFNENKSRYGYRRITLELKNRGFNINYKTVSKLMNILGIKSIQRPKDDIIHIKEAIVNIFKQRF